MARAAIAARAIGTAAPTERLGYDSQRGGNEPHQGPDLVQPNTENRQRLTLIELVELFGHPRLMFPDVTILDYRCVSLADTPMRGTAFGCGGKRWKEAVRAG